MATEDEKIVQNPNVAPVKTMSSATSSPVASATSQPVATTPPLPTEPEEYMSYEEWLKKNPPSAEGNWPGRTDPSNKTSNGRAVYEYDKAQWAKGKGDTDTSKQYTPGGDITTKNIQDVANETVKSGGSNIINAANGTSASDAIKDQNMTAAQVDPNDPNFKLGETPQVNSTNVNQVNPTQAHGYETTKTQDQVAQNQMDAAQGTVSDKAQIKDVPQADTTGIATGTNKDGTVNELGQALQKYASQNMSTIIDTSTAAGKLLAQQLGDGNYIDSKATLQGQLELLQSQFVDPQTGEAKIPSWAASTARNVSKIAAFSGMSGTAATAAMSQALLEASLPIAQQDAEFFQTLTVKNLDNKQQATINAATVLAKFEQTNLDNRMTAAVQNAQAFLAMDMKNLDNEQQAKVINNQAMIQSILEDAKAENVKNQFLAQSQNDVDKFYASLNTQIAQFNSAQTLDAQKFNASLEDSRQKFYSEQQYNIAVANANWRNQVQLQDDQQKYEAATQDVKNAVDISVNQLNQLWDRADSLLDYAWQSSEKEKDRATSIAVAKMQIKAQKDGANAGAIGSIVGSFVGSDAFSDMVGGLF